MKKRAQCRALKRKMPQCKRTKEVSQRPRKATWTRNRSCWFRSRPTGWGDIDMTGSASPCLLGRRRAGGKPSIWGGNTGLCQNPSFRHTTGVPKNGLAPFGILHCRGLISSCAPPATRGLGGSATARALRCSRGRHCTRRIPLGAATLQLLSACESNGQSVSRQVPSTTVL
jgi:hypothetical protein